MSEFLEKIAVVTGGADGIGRQLVIELAECGTEVFFCGRRPDASEVLDKCCGHGHYFMCDIANEEDIRRFISNTLAFKGSIDYLVNNVASDDRNSFEEVTPEKFDNFIAVNLRAAVLTAREALPGLRHGTGRSIVNLGTTNWMLGLKPFTLYSASKAGLLGFTRALARELGADRIRVNMVSPGWVMTRKQLKLYVTEQDKADLMRDQALPFLLTEKNITPAIRFLLSSEADGITGQNLIVDGGKLMQ